MKTFDIVITGRTPLLMHWDNIEWADQLDAWKNNASNKKNSRAGDDRSPAWRWVGSAYHDGEVLGMPGDNLMRCLMEGGTMVPVPGAKGSKTFKSQTQSGMMVNEAYWPLDVDGRNIRWDSITPLLQEEDFAAHKSRCEGLGFSLHVKRAKVGTAKHIRVRPRFDTWSLRGSVSVWDKQITTSALTDFLRYAGQYKGLGDWRPGAPKSPGTFGMFEATLAERN